MALDEALAVSVRPGEGMVRLYGWAPPTISFGRNQSASGRFDRSAAASRGIDFVRRPTGGRAVLHDREVTYAAVFPKKALGSPRGAYALIHEGLARGLNRLGVDARVVGPEEGQVLPPDAGPCFRAPAPGELVVGGRKVVGSAQVRIGDGLLQHGSILVGGSQDVLAELGDGGDAGDARPVTLEELLGEAPGSGEVMEAVRVGLEAELGGTWREEGYTRAELAEAGKLVSRYRSEAWTWRR